MMIKSEDVIFKLGHDLLNDLDRGQRVRYTKETVHHHLEHI